MKLQEDRYIIQILSAVQSSAAGLMIARAVANGGRRLSQFTTTLPLPVTAFPRKNVSIAVITEVVLEFHLSKSSLP